MNDKKTTLFSAFGGLSLWRFLWLLFCSFMTALWSSEIWAVKTEPEKYVYVWGGEGPVAGLWYYASESVYSLHLVCLIVWFLFGMLLCLRRWPFRRELLPAHFGLSVLWLAAAYMTN